MPTNWDSHIDGFLPEDGLDGTLVGRIWRPDAGGPSVVSIRADGVVDITAVAPTMSVLTNDEDPTRLAATTGENLGEHGEMGYLARPDAVARRADQVAIVGREEEVVDRFADLDPPKGK